VDTGQLFRTADYMHGGGGFPDLLYRGVGWVLHSRSLDILNETRDHTFLNLGPVAFAPADSLLVVMVDRSDGRGGPPTIIGSVTLPRLPTPGFTADHTEIVRAAVAQSPLVREFLRP
jgi:hypothetical protein